MFFSKDFALIFSKKASNYEFFVNIFKNLKKRTPNGVLFSLV